jgi:polar amino acid transport system substrate-binding protein
MRSFEARLTRAMLVVSAVLTIAILACATAGAQVQAPKRIADKGKLVFCTDLSYPPWEEVDPTSMQPAGIDIDVAAAIAKQMGVTSEHKNITFDGLIPALQAGQCDAIISTMIDKPARREVVDFVDYTNQGNCVIVLATSTLSFNGLADMTGKKVAVQSSTVAEDDLAKVNATLKSQGKAEMTIVALPNNVDAIQQLNAGLVDAYYGVPEQAHYLNEQKPGSVKIASPTMGARPAGIATLKKDHDLHDAINAAYEALKANGDYDRIFTKAGVQSLELK